MKIRLGFVSNSSSSSFIVRFPHKPTSIEECQQMLFGDRLEYPNPYPYEGCQEYWPTLLVADTVFNDLKNQEPIGASQLNDHYYHDYMYGPAVDDFLKENPVPDLWDYKGYQSLNWKDEKDRKRMGEIQTEHNAIMAAWKAKLVAHLMKYFAKAGGEWFYFTYADEDGSYGSALEHGQLFKKLDHVRISNH